MTNKKGRGKGRGWYNDPYKHALASKGVKTRFKAHGDEIKSVYDKLPEWKKELIDEAREAYKTGETLEDFLNSPEGRRYMRKIYFEDMYEVPWEGEASPPYWIDQYEGLGEKWYSPDDDDIVQHVSGYREPLSYGWIKEGDDLETGEDDEDYVYLGSILTQNGEVEEQADDGESVMYNYGSWYLRLWRSLSEFKNVTGDTGYPSRGTTVSFKVPRGYFEHNYEIENIYRDGGRTFYLINKDGERWMALEKDVRW